jgi:hypothetical protein
VVVVLLVVVVVVLLERGIYLCLGGENFRIGGASSSERK